MMMSSESEWPTIAQTGQHPPYSNDVRRIIADVNDLVSDRQLDVLAADLANLDPEQMSVAVMVAIYRTTAPLKDEIAGWQEFEAKLHAELSRRERQDVSLGVGPEEIDDARVMMFEALAHNLQSTSLEEEIAGLKPAPLSRRASANQAFVEAWLSNFLEGVRFSISRAEGILFRNDIPSGKEVEARDLIGTYDVIFNETLAPTPETFEQFEKQILEAHATVMQSRRDKLPGRYRTFRVGSGTYNFVDPNRVRPTLQAGFEIMRSIEGPFPRAAFLAFFVSEVHPFMDGNGRVSRLMMNAELARAALPRIVIPENLWAGYRSGLRDLSLHGDETELVTILQIGLVWSSAVPWDNRNKALKAIGEAKSAMYGKKASEAWIAKYLT